MDNNSDIWIGVRVLEVFQTVLHTKNVNIFFNKGIQTYLDLMMNLY